MSRYRRRAIDERRNQSSIYIYNSVGSAVLRLRARERWHPNKDTGVEGWSYSLGVWK